MKKKATVAVDTIAIAVTTFGNDPQPLTLKEGSTVKDALEAAGIEYSRQEIFVSGEDADLEDELEDGDVVSVVTPKKAG